VKRALLILLLVARVAHADPTSLLQGLDTDSKPELDAAVSAIEHAPTTPDLADVLFAAGRACEDRLLDPARALALYDRILRELPDAGVAIAAERRVERLKSVRGHEKEAAHFAELVARADELDPATIKQEAEALASAPWPGAIDTSLWLGDWLCRTRRFADAQDRYAKLRAQWPDSDQARMAHRNAAGCALDAHDYGLARTLAEELVVVDDADAAVKQDLLAAARQGRIREALYTASWIALLLAAVLLVASLVEASLRGGRRRPALRPPIEVQFLAPVAFVIVLGSYLSRAAIAPAVLRISIAGLVLAHISGITLDLLRVRGRAVRLRAVLHVVACALAVLGVGYIAIMREGLLDMFVETVRYGPGH
jgi:tetratricopeptide (TPR) repeat protein